MKLKIKKILPRVLMMLVLCAILFAPISSLAQGGTPPATPTQANKLEQQQQNLDDFVSNNLNCWENNKLNLAGCGALFTYYVLYVPTSFLLALSGTLFDYFLFFTIKSETYSGVFADFIEQGWRILRDIANIAFIFILLYLAIRIILDLKAAEAKKFIFNVVLIALLINFSLFFTRVIVDAGNIFAHVFYNAINKNDRGDSNNGGAKSISTTLVGLYNPARLFQVFGGTTGASELSISTPIKNAPPVKLVKPEDRKASLFLIFALLGTILNVVTLYVFLAVMLLFLARTVGLWIVMLFAPIAFISYIVPKIEGVPTGVGGGFLSWSGWWKELFSYTMLAPIFLFFLYIIVLFLTFTSATLAKEFGNSSTLQDIMKIFFPFAVVIVILLQAKSIAKSMSGKVGEVIMTGAKTVAGAVGGMAIGSAAFLGREVVGRGAYLALGEERRRGAVGELKEIERKGKEGEEEKRTATMERKEVPETKEMGHPEEEVITTAPLGEVAETTEESSEDKDIKRYADMVSQKEKQKALNESLGQGAMNSTIDKDIQELKQQIEKKKVEKETKATTKAAETTTKEAEKKAEEKKAAEKTTAKEVAKPEAKEGKTLKDYASEDNKRGWLARQAVKTLDTAQKASWDGRNTWLLKQVEKHTGIGFGKAGGRGGFEAAQKERIEKDKEFAKILRPNDKELKELHTIENRLLDLKIELKKFNEKELFVHDKDGKRTDVAKAGADPTLINTYNNLADQISTWQQKSFAEQKRMNLITSQRLKNYATVTQKGRGTNYVLNISTFGAFGSAQGEMSAKGLRSEALKIGEKASDTEQIMAALKKLEESKKAA